MKYLHKIKSLCSSQNYCIKRKFIFYGLSPLLMQNPYSKYILVIKTLIFDRFTKFLQVLLRQIEIKMLNRKHIPSLPAGKYSRQNSLSEVCFYTLGVAEINSVAFQIPSASLEAYNEPRHEKTNVPVSDLVLHKPGCTVTEDG